MKRGVAGGQQHHFHRGLRGWRKQGFSQSKSCSSSFNFQGEIIDA